MNEPELQVVVERMKEACVLRVRGPVDHVQNYKLDEAIQTQLDRRQSRVIVDLSELTYITSAGINTLGHAFSQFEKLGWSLRFVRPLKDHHWQLFEMIGVDAIFPWAATLEEALRQMPPSPDPAAP